MRASVEAADDVKNNEGVAAGARQEGWGTQFKEKGAPSEGGGPSSSSSSRVLEKAVRQRSKRPGWGGHAGLFA